MFFRKKKDALTINSHIDGKIIDLEEIPDKVFSSRAMGDGFAVVASSNIVQSPSKGIINFIAETNHAIGIKLKSEIQILIHIGLDSATTKKENFKVKVKEGQEVNIGDELVEIDSELLKSELYIPLVIIENPNRVEYNISNLNKEENRGVKVISFE